MAPHKTYGVPANDEDDWIAEQNIAPEDLDALLAQEDEDDPMDEYRELY